MTNFYNINKQIINSAYEYPCIYEDIYIFNMDENQLLISYEPSFMQNTNGIVIGIDSRFTNFYIIDKDNIIIKSLKINWINDCSESVVELETNSFNYKNYLFITLLIVTLVIIVLLKLKRRSK